MNFLFEGNIVYYFSLEINTIALSLKNLQPEKLTKLMVSLHDMEKIIFSRITLKKS